MTTHRLVRGLLSGRAIAFLPYIPRTVLLFKNWGAVLSAYAGVGETPTEIRLRSGPGIQIHDRVDVTTVIVVWVRRDYGEPPSGGTVIDIGANIGAFTVLAALTGLRVLAYEPMPANYSQLEQNVAANGLSDRVTLEQAGVTGGGATRRLYLGAGSPYHSIYASTPNADYVEMETTTLDRIFQVHDLHECHLLKMDCEGAEFEIIYGTSAATLRQIREIRMEYHDRSTPEDHNATVLEQYLSEYGFRRIKKDEATRMLWLARSPSAAA